MKTQKMKNKKLTYNDLCLINEAENLKAIYWGDAWDLAEKADTPEAVEIIISIGKGKFHKEEYSL